MVWATDREGKKVWVDRYYEGRGLSSTHGWESREARLKRRYTKKRKIRRHGFWGSKGGLV